MSGDATTPETIDYPAGALNPKDYDKSITISTATGLPYGFIIEISDRSEGKRLSLYEGEGPLAGKGQRIEALKERLRSVHPYLRHLKRARGGKDHPEFDLRLLPSLDDASGSRAEGNDLIIVTASGKALHFRIVAVDGTVVFDADETALVGPAGQIEDLRRQLGGLWPPHELTSTEKAQVIATVTSIVDYALIDQIIEDVVSIIGQEPEARKSLVAVAESWRDTSDQPGNPHVAFRVFDDRGDLVADSSEADLRDRSGTQIDELKERLKPLWHGPLLTWEDEQQIIEDVASILDQEGIWEPKTRTSRFNEHAEVRVIKVRAWVLGIHTSDNMCYVIIKHMGNESFRREDRTKVDLTHDPVEGIQFTYDWSKVLWNFQGDYVESPELSLLHGGTDGDLHLHGKLANSDYLPLIGPFAEWEISIKDDDNANLDRSKITAICLDFHILSKTVEKWRPRAT